MTTSDKEKREKDLQQAEACLNAGSEARKDGKLDQAADAFGEAETRFRLIGNLKRAGESCSLLAATQVQNHMPEQAIRSYQRAARLYKEADRPVSEAESYLAIGRIERQLAQLDRAQASYQVAQHLSRANGDLQGLGNTALALGHIALQLGMFEEAVDSYREAAHFFQEAGDAIHEADAYRSLAEVQRMTGHFPEAEAGYQRAQEMYQAANDVLGGIDAQLGLARVFLKEAQQLDRSAALLADALTSSLSLDYKLGQADANLSLARMSLLYAGLYAQTVITDVQRNQDEQAQALLHHFARLSCGAELVRHLEAYEHALPAQGEKAPEGELLSSVHELVRLITAYEDAVSMQREGVLEEELLSNRKLVERLKQIRSGL